MVNRIINGTLTSTQEFEEIYPFRSNFMNIGGHDLHYIDRGQGTPVVMLHGNPTWSFYYRNLIAALSNDFRAIVPDHIGCGLSDKPSPSHYDYTLGSRVSDLNILIERLCPGEKIHLIVHDWGGMIGLAWAMDHLDQVDKIIITNTSGFFLPKDKTLPLRLWIIKYLTWFATPAVLGLNLFSEAALYMASKKLMPAKVKKGLTAPYNSWKNRIATLKFVQDIPINEKDPCYRIVENVDQRLTMLDDHKLLFLWGAKDFVFDLTFFNEFKHRFPGSHSHVFNNAGHYLFEDEPERTTDLIFDFLK